MQNANVGHNAIAQWHPCAEEVAEEESPGKAYPFLLGLADFVGAFFAPPAR